MEFEIVEGTVDDWKEIDRVNRVVLPENYDELFYRSILSSPTTICFVVLKPDCQETAESAETAQTAETADVADVADDLDNDFEDELDEGFETKNDNAREIVGYIITILQFDQHKRLTGHVVSVGVLPEFRSRGLGSKLFEHTENVIQKKFQVIKTITLHVRKTNKRAIKFYCQNGYMRSKKVKGYYGAVDGFLMKKVLG